MPLLQLSEVFIEGKAYPVKIKDFKSSKSIKLRVQNSCILITKPSNVSRAKALKFLEENEEWVSSRLRESCESLEDFLAQTQALYIYQEAFKLILIKGEGSTPSCISNTARGEILFSYSTNAELAELFLKLAKKVLSEKAQHTANSFGLSLSRVTIRSQRSLWGSRSSSGTLSLNWRMLLLPESLQNYIICHELAHIKFMDHSTSFWIYLNTLCPKSKRLDKSLGEHSLRIFKLAIE